jgi:hypothetical protein
MAAIDRAMARMPAAAPGNPPAAPTPAAPRHVPSGGGRFAVLGTWVRVILGAALAVGITQWPYPTACGVNLAVYGGAILSIIVAGAWSSLSSWRRQLGLAHLISLLVLLWGLLLAAREVLPRTGYARETRLWVCQSAVERS